MKEANTPIQGKREKKPRKLSEVRTFLTPPDEPYNSVFVRIQLRYNNLDWPSYEAVSERKQRLQFEGCRVKIEPLNIEIPNEYIGIEDRWMKTLFGERLKSRKYLQTQVEHIEKKTIVSQETCFEVPRDAQSGNCNTPHS